MAEISDEMLMAYADGALDPITSAAVETALQEHSEYREKVDKFRATRDPVRIAFQQDLGAGRLGPLIDRLRRDEVPPAAAAQWSTGRVVPLPGGAAPTRALRFRHHLPAAMAASVALLVGATLGWLTHPAPTVTSRPASGLIGFSEGRLLAQGPLQELLEGTSSGVPVGAKTAAGEAWTLKATFTFRSTSRRPCRRYEIGNETTSRFAGYACRNEEGRWLVQAHAGVRPKGQIGTDYVPAAGDADAALEASIRIAMDGDVYQAKEEAQLIASRWIAVRK